MSIMKQMKSKRLAKTILCALAVGGGMLAGMGQAYAADPPTYIYGATPVTVGASTLWIRSSSSAVIISVDASKGIEYDPAGIICGAAASSSVSGGIVNVIGGNVTAGKYVYGGNVISQSHGAYAVSNNIINILDGTVACAVAGNDDGTGGDGNVRENVVNISGGTVTDSILGGYIKDGNSGSAIQNVVNISGGTIGSSAESSVIGGIVYGSGNAIGNVVNISGDSKIIPHTDIGDSTPVTVIGGWAHGSGIASDNIINIKGGDISANIIGGQSNNNSAMNNSVNINGGKIYIDPGYAFLPLHTSVAVIGGYATGNGSASGNTISISGGEINATVVGGEAYGTGNASYNTVTLNTGVKVTGDVYGGSAKNATPDNAGKAIGNVITLKGDTNIKKMYGGMSQSGFSANNLLNVSGYGNIAENIDSFQKLHFSLGSGDNKGKILLHLDSADSTENTVLNNFESITITAAPGAKLNNGDRAILINKGGEGKLDIKLSETEYLVTPTKSFNTAAIISPIKAIAGEVSLIELGTQGVDNDLVFTSLGDLNLSDNSEMADNAKSTAETRANGAALLNEGGDFIMEQGLAGAKTALKQSDTAGSKHPVPFAAVGGGSMRYETGSHVDSKSWHGAVGVAKQVKDITFGLAVQHGQSSYDSYVNAAHGDGTSKATGAAVFVEKRTDSGTHFDGALRVGRVKNDYSATLTLMGIPQHLSYNESSTYYGVSIGGGKEFSLKNNDKLDIYGRYYWTHTNSSDVTTNFGDSLSFDAINSHRIRLGGRYTHRVNDRNELYAGLAWQYEFGSKAKAAVNGDAAPVPSLEGNSGMLELGWKTEAAKNLTIDLSLNGWVGKQRGISGGASFRWSF